MTILPGPPLSGALTRPMDGRNPEPTMFTHSIGLDALTVIATDDNGERHDLNARGEHCADLADLRAFIRELHAQGAYDAETRDRLLAEAS